MYGWELGPIEGNITRQAANMGLAKPVAMAEKPEALPGNTLWLKAFYDLDGERQVGMSVGRIPWSAVDYYATVYEFTTPQRIALHYLVGRMDAANLERISEQIKSKSHVKS